MPQIWTGFYLEVLNRAYRILVRFDGFDFNLNDPKTGKFGQGKTLRLVSKLLVLKLLIKFTENEQNFLFVYFDLKLFGPNTYNRNFLSGA